MYQPANYLCGSRQRDYEGGDFQKDSTNKQLCQHLIRQSDAWHLLVALFQGGVGWLIYLGQNTLLLIMVSVFLKCIFLIFISYSYACSRVMFEADSSAVKQANASGWIIVLHFRY